MKLAFLLAASVAFVLIGGVATAADSSDPPPEAARAAPTSPLATTRSHLKAQRWGAALDELRRIDARADADWNNLMGYALRSQPRPDLDGAQRHYDAALRIDPLHQGALEYAGELALLKRDVATADAHLATLSRLCRSPCEPLDDLKAAVARYRAANKP